MKLGSADCQVKRTLAGLSVVYMLTLLAVVINLYVVYIPGRLLTTIVPLVFIYLRFTVTNNPLAYLKLTGSDLWEGLRDAAIVCVFFAWAMLYKAVMDGHGYLQWNWSAGELFHLVGAASLAEEIVFRGVLLPGLAGILGGSSANSIVSLLFVFIHYPCWLLDGMNGIAIWQNAGYIFIFSYFLGYVYSCSRSLWLPVLLHSTNNYLALVTIAVFS